MVEDGPGWGHLCQKKKKKKKKKKKAEKKIIIIIRFIYVPFIEQLQPSTFPYIVEITGMSF